MISFAKSRMNQFTYREWIGWFAHNNDQRLAIDFSKEKGLSEEEAKLIFPSIREFQKGRRIRRKVPLQAVDQFACRTGMEEYREAMEWFVKEENWHSAYLRKFMDYYRVEVKDRSFLDQIFRKLRKAGGIKGEVTVLVTAEMIALTYYDALAKVQIPPR